MYLKAQRQSSNNVHSLRKNLRVWRGKTQCKIKGKQSFTKTHYQESYHTSHISALSLDANLRAQYDKIGLGCKEMLVLLEGQTRFPSSCIHRETCKPSCTKVTIVLDIHRYLQSSDVIIRRILQKIIQNLEIGSWLSIISTAGSTHHGLVIQQACKIGQTSYVDLGALVNRFNLKLTVHNNPIGPIMCQAIADLEQLADEWKVS